MTLYIVNHSWNEQGYGHGAKAEVFKTREEAENRMNTAREALLDMMKDDEERLDFWCDKTTCELYDNEDSSNFEHYELTEENIEL